jgi:hypothetical protein
MKTKSALMKKLLPFLLLLIVQFATAQTGLEVRQIRKLKSINLNMTACRPDTFLVSITKIDSAFAANDSIFLRIQFPHGMSLNNIYYTDPFWSVSLVSNNPDSTKLWFKNHTFSGNVFTFYFTAMPSCRFFTGILSDSLHNNVDAWLNNTTLLPDSSLTYIPYNVNSANIQEAALINVMHDSAYYNLPYQREFDYKNTSNTDFTGDIEFTDHMTLGNNSILKFDSIKALIGTTPVPIMYSVKTNSLVKMRIFLNGFHYTDTLKFIEKVRLTGCISTPADNPTSVFKIEYGCHNDSLPLCFSSAPETASAVKGPKIPIIQCNLLTKSYGSCLSESVNRTVRIKNIGTADAYGIHASFVTMCDHWLYDIDSTTIKVYRNNSGIITTVPFTFSNNYTNFWQYAIHGFIANNITIAPGDSIFVDYTEVPKCVDTSDYNHYFGAASCDDGFRLFTRFVHPCDSTPLMGAFPSELVYNNIFSLDQIFENLVSTIIGNSSIVDPINDQWFEVKNATPLRIGNYDIGGHTYVTTNNLDSSEIIVKLDLGKGLGFVNPDSIFLLSNYGYANHYIYPDNVSITYGSGNISDPGDVDKAIVHFKIDTSFYHQITPGPSNLNCSYQYKAKYEQFFNNFKVKYKLRAYCKYMPDNGRAGIGESFFYDYNKHCDQNCLIPLAKVSDTINIHCPGCKLPGWNLSMFDLRRMNIGIADTNNNNYPDHFPMQQANLNDVQYQHIIKGDSISCDIAGDITDGEGGRHSTMNTLGFQLKYGQLVIISNNIANDFKFLGAKGTYTRDSISDSLTVPANSISVIDNNTLVIDLSINKLYQYGIDSMLLKLDSFNVYDKIRIKPEFRALRNYTTPTYYNQISMDARIEMSGTPFASIKTDANGLYEDSTLIPWDTLTAIERSELEYWCTGFGSNFVGIGTSFDMANNFYNWGVNPSGYEDPCYKTMYNYSATAVGVNIGVGGLWWDYGNQNTFNSFSYELRNLWMNDTVTFKYPSDYVPAGINVGIRSLYYNTGTNAMEFNTVTLPDTLLAGTIIDPVHNTISIPLKLIQFYTTWQNLIPQPSTAFDEYKRYYINLILKMKDYHTTQNLIALDPVNNPVRTHWYNYPGTLTGDTVIMAYFNTSDSLEKPKATLTNQTSSTGPTLQHYYNWDTYLFVPYDTVIAPNYWNIFTNNRANNTFINFQSPSGNIHVTDVTVNSGGTYVPIPAASVMGGIFLGADTLYKLGMLGIGYQTPTLTKQIKFSADYDCSHLGENDVNDTLLMITGWNCYNYPDTLHNACYLDTLKVPVQVKVSNLQANFIQSNDTIHVCDTLTYKILLDAQGSGDILNTLVQLKPPVSNEFTYLPNSASVYSLQHPTIHTALSPIDSAGYLNWYLDSVSFLHSGFNGLGDDYVLQFKLVTGCSFENNGISLNVKANTYCGRQIGPLPLLAKPNLVIGKPLPDSLSITAWTDSLTLCKDSAWVTMVVSNNSNSSSNGINTLNLWHSSNLSYSGGDMYNTSTANVYTWNLPTLLAHAVDTVHCWLDANGCQPFKYAINLLSKKSLSCNGDTCLYI